MNTQLRQRSESGFSLVVVFVIVGVAFLILAGVMNWIASSSSLASRREEYYNSLGAAEAATEKIVATMVRDFQGAAERSDHMGADITAIDGSLSTYQGQYPSSAETGVDASYEFSGPTIGADATYVAKAVDRAWGQLNWKYPGFNGYTTTYRIVSNARDTGSDKNIISAYRQDIQLASIPLFEYAIFYAMDLEFCPSSAFTISGPVHCNGTIYNQPNLATVTYQKDVTATGSILNDSSPLDPTVRTLGTVSYLSARDNQASPLVLPIGLPNTSSNLHQILELPSGGLGSDTSTPLGQQRYCNNADLIILVYNTNVVVKSGAYNGFSTTLGWANISSFVTITNLPWDAREQKWVKTTEIRINNLNSAMPTLNSWLSRNVNSLYVADLRDVTSTNITAVRVRSATSLYSGGLTLATPNPLYVRGSFNTTSPKKASLACDAITVLSSGGGGWTDSESNQPLGSRVAGSSCTINAAVVTGIVASDGTDYSGGAENVFRFLEDWTSRSFTLSGSIAVLYKSQMATAPWNPNNVYVPPSRTFNFNTGYTNYANLPTGTPYLRTLIRDQRLAAQPNSTY